MTSARRLLAVAGLAGAVALAAYAFTPSPASTEPEQAARRIAVETVPLARGTLIDRRVFPGNMEAAAEFTVAPKVAGRVSEVAVDLGDEVTRGQIVARMDDEEFAQAVAQAQAELQVARAQLREAASARKRADAALGRVGRLADKGIASASELDDADAEAAGTAAAVAVARAQIAQAQAQLESAQVRLGYTRVTADWPGSDKTRLVGAAMVHAGNTVAANTPIISIVATRRLRAVIQVPQSVYGALTKGQQAQVTARAYPETRFAAQVARIAPRFDPASRQARVELTVENPDRALAPGMFVQVAIETERIDNAWIVPASALVARSGDSGIFTFAEDDEEVARFLPAQASLQVGDRIALQGIEPVGGDVVVLGQDLLTDGAAVTRSKTR